MDCFDNYPKTIEKTIHFNEYDPHWCKGLKSVRVIDVI